MLLLLLSGFFCLFLFGEFGYTVSMWTSFILLNIHELPGYIMPFTECVSFQSLFFQVFLLFSLFSPVIFLYVCWYTCWGPTLFLGSINPFFFFFCSSDWIPPIDLSWSLLFWLLKSSLEPFQWLSHLLLCFLILEFQFHSLCDFPLLKFSIWFYWFPLVLCSWFP